MDNKVKPHRNFDNRNRENLNQIIMNLQIYFLKNRNVYFESILIKE